MLELSSTIRILAIVASQNALVSCPKYYVETNFKNGVSKSAEYGNNC